jgi:hypothetical protein
MTNLIKRLEEAEAGSRELDCEIAVLLDGFFTLPPMWEGGPIGYGYTDKSGVRISPGHGGDQLVRRYTTSLDAALALAERVLPGWCWMIERHKNGTATAWLHEWNAYGEGEQVVANTPALALCAAILKATDTGRE